MPLTLFSFTGTSGLIQENEFQVGLATIIPHIKATGCLSSLLLSGHPNPPGFISFIVIYSSRRRPTPLFLIPGFASQRRLQSQRSGLRNSGIPRQRAAGANEHLRASAAAQRTRTGRVFSHKGAELKKPLISQKHLHRSSRFARTFQALLFQA